MFKVGLAVDDIKSVQNKALLKRLAMRAKLVLEIEYIAPEVIRRKFMVGRETVSATQTLPFLIRLIRFFFPKSKSENVVDAAAELFGEKINNPEETGQYNTRLAEDVNNLQKSVDELKLQQNEMKVLLSEIAAYMIATKEPQNEKQDG